MKQRSSGTQCDLKHGVTCKSVFVFMDDVFHGS